jgi:hypothetical protein
VSAPLAAAQVGTAGMQAGQQVSIAVGGTPADFIRSSIAASSFGGNRRAREDGSGSGSGSAAQQQAGAAGTQRAALPSLPTPRSTVLSDGVGVSKPRSMADTTYDVQMRNLPIILLLLLTSTACLVVLMWTFYTIYKRYAPRGLPSRAGAAPSSQPYPVLSPSAGCDHAQWLTWP